MADTRRTLSALQALLADNTAGDISAQDMRDVIVSGDSHWTFATGADAATAMAVQTWYNVDMSAWATADRIYSLPSTADVGDRVAVCITAGNTSTFEMDLRTTAASGDTINGINRDASSWSRLFSTGEGVVFRCVVANTDWVVEFDGRKPTMGFLRLSTDAPATEASNVYYYPTVPASGTPGAWTADIDYGSITDVTTDKIKIRRACNAIIGAWALCKGAQTAGNGWTVQIEKNGATQILYSKTISAAATVNSTMASLTQAASFVSGDYIRYKYRTETINMGLLSHTAIPYCGMSFVEVLNPS